MRVKSAPMHLLTLNACTSCIVRTTFLIWIYFVKGDSKNVSLFVSGLQDAYESKKTIKRKKVKNIGALLSPTVSFSARNLLRFDIKLFTRNKRFCLSKKT